MENVIDLPLIGRAAEVVPSSVNAEERTVEIVWTTGATVQRVRWEGWDDRIEYDEELVVSGNAVRLDRLNAGAPFLNAHSAWRAESVLGSVVPGSVRIEGGQGFAMIQLTAAEDARGIVQRILEKNLRFVSVGYRVHQYEITRKEGAREHWRAVDWEPLEISAVPIPADPGSQVRSGASRTAALAPCVLVRQDVTAAPAAQSEGDKTMSRNNQQAAADETERRETVETMETRAAASGPAASTPIETPALDAEAVRAEERSRVTTITSLCIRHGLDDAFRHDLITRGVPLEDARAAILDQIADADPLNGRASEPAPALARDEREGVQYREAMANALLHRANAPGTDLSDGGREFRGMSLMELARHALERSGVNTRGMGRMEMAAAALGQRAAGYHTTGDFPAVLANIGNLTLREAYRATPRTFAAWARRATLSDFRPTTRVQVSNAPQLEKVPEGAEFKYGTFGEASTQYALATYGKIIAFSRQMLINDDLGAFTRVANSFGARAAQLEGDLVYAILLQNPAMADGTALFHANHGNLGTAAVIGEHALIEAYEAFAAQTDIDGTAIDVSPEFILVPPGQRAVEARKLLTSTTPANTEDVNTFANRLTVVEERRLMPTGSAKAPWFLAASTGLIDTVEYAYLDGQDGVFTETRNGFEVDGVEIKARLDFAAAAIDWRGLYKNAGADPV
ncbi:HK97 family phage prohead protease [Devosia sp. YIM 151766]|uniref:prohead protease/major capsid protein fusion protein n=1 Tax=Devosia sp. YIM 151766 TaxID=3017325 RepID=UPI00255D033D|nr:prohead protease/major capsid protein fusion protein [Devosia sp. YIM 151766]WIY52454.1 HK97 family phage prohead protease [Devosia sp. YIM 151766]